MRVCVKYILFAKKTSEVYKSIRGPSSLILVCVRRLTVFNSAAEIAAGTKGLGGEIGAGEDSLLPRCDAAAVTRIIINIFALDEQHEIAKSQEN